MVKNLIDSLEERSMKVVDHINATHTHTHISDAYIKVRRNSAFQSNGFICSDSDRWSEFVVVVWWGSAKYGLHVIYVTLIFIEKKIQWCSFVLECLSFVEITNKKIAIFYHVIFAMLFSNEKKKSRQKKKFFEHMRKHWKNPRKITKNSTERCESQFWTASLSHTPHLRSTFSATLVCQLIVLPQFVPLI